MSDTAEGPGWWQASDGKWYAPVPPTRSLPHPRLRRLPREQPVRKAESIRPSGS